MTFTFPFTGFVLYAPNNVFLVTANSEGNIIKKIYPLAFASQKVTREPVETLRLRESLHPL